MAVGAVDVLDRVEDVEVERRGDEVRADALDEVRTGSQLLPGEPLRDDRRLGRLDGDRERPRACAP